MLDNLKKLREETGITQRRLAEVIGVSQQSINKYENHNIEPDIETLCLIADFFNTSIDYLVGRVDSRRKIEEVKVFELSKAESNMLTKYRKLTQKQQNCINIVLDSYK